MEPVIFHIDVNSAYLSWTAVEQLKNGAEIDIREIPAIIGGDQESRHGVVLAKSGPAKTFGIRTGEPVANAFRKCPNLKTYPPDHKMYREKSRMLMEYLTDFCPDIEQVSVDECYMDFTGVMHRYASPTEAACQLKDGIRNRFGFTVNVGISSNKLLAKMASDFEKPDKVHTLFPDEIEEKMWPLPVGELYMAGRSSVETLKKLEILTIGDLAKSDVKLIELHLKSHGRMLWKFANGIDDSEVHVEQAEAKGIGNSTTLKEDLVTEEEAYPVLLMLAESVGRRLRQAGQKAGMVSVEIKYHTFRKVSHQQQLTKSTDSDEELYRTACHLFREVWSGEPVRLLGIRTSKLSVEEEPEQLTIFDLQGGQAEGVDSGKVQESASETKTQDQKEKQKRLSEAVDIIRKKYGEGAITRGIFLEKSQRNKEQKEGKTDAGKEL